MCSTYVCRVKNDMVLANLNLNISTLHLSYDHKRGPCFGGSSY